MRLLAKEFSHLFNITPIWFHFDRDLFYAFRIASILITAIECFEEQIANSSCAKGQTESRQS